MKWIDSIFHGQAEEVSYQEASSVEADTKEKHTKESFVIMALLGILLLIIVLPTGSSNREKDASPKEEESTSDTITESSLTLSQTQSYARALEKRLEETLRCMDGAGAVKVMITLQSTEEAVVEKDKPVTRNNTVETDAQGGTRSVNEYSENESTVYGTDQNGQNTPYVVKRLEPAIEGVVVIAQGGGSERLCKNITEAIQVLFGIEPHKIKVVKMKTTG